MIKDSIKKCTAIVLLFSTITSCSLPKLSNSLPGKNLPDAYAKFAPNPNGNVGNLQWRNYFKDQYLEQLIDTALVNNQELNIALQDIEIAKNEIRARKGQYLPFVNGAGGAGVEKVGRYTRNGASEASNDIKPGTATPEPLSDFLIGAMASWEVDIWHKLRNARKAAVSRYLATVQGRNFMITNLIAEIASTYYELMALDNELDIIKANIKIQSNALEIVKAEKQATRVTELAVRRFEAQVLHTRSLQFVTEQKVVEAENKLNYLTGSYPRTLPRSSASFQTLNTDTNLVGIPTQLLDNRPDIKAAQLAITAANLDLKSVKTYFYPSLNLSAGLGFNAFSLGLLVNTPSSLMYSIAAGITGPLVNRNGIKAQYLNANARQIQAIYDYQRTQLNAVQEVSNQLSNARNLQKSYILKEGEVAALNLSVSIANSLFMSARADYVEILLTQRDAQESKFQLVEIKLQQMQSVVKVYRALGGGWQ